MPKPGPLPQTSQTLATVELLAERDLVDAPEPMTLRATAQV